MPLRASVEQHDGLTAISEGAFLDFFANAVPRDKARVLYAVQEPTTASPFGERTTVAAWRSNPSWYAMPKQSQSRRAELIRNHPSDGLISASRSR
jgi:hypothetical protein